MLNKFNYDGGDDVVIIVGCRSQNWQRSSVARSRADEWTNLAICFIGQN
jgi:hypothetical protein